uniref:Uncharacterized protein n=1 Tax=Percolomonas cosmopolitus TaxID=63605 RepID=A0A7S1PHU0_9EUKA|mmetsp:Transcript_9194/g.33939  ORF Transcript_9194/g.33939 Transcript_9194/m.33939 type:complete len:948 (+) Transcript_9194:502-3345(+)|eukprot:CAMPEP_0117450686 /NCGR_PEP_ID=MMETSP0759-20121206/8601_1 /TAXON_ID=63605 /ORGANISM="Percolomonas cosmopolitus, Strain WS" /LENGTH=947 /DNA_ID=CAMNT_0005243225 /DNA_START=462 /DNA_END=3305 /DNA_ORIENTATION=-
MRTPTLLQTQSAENNIIIDDTFISDISDDSLRQWCETSLYEKGENPYTLHEIFDKGSEKFKSDFTSKKDRRMADSFYTYLSRQFLRADSPPQSLRFLPVEQHILPKWDDTSLSHSLGINDNAILYLDNCIDVQLGAYMNTGVESLQIFACLVRQRRSNNVKGVDLPVLTDNFGSGKTSCAKNFLSMTRLVYRYLGKRFYALIRRFETEGRGFVFDGESLLRKFLVDSSHESDYTPEPEWRKVVDDLVRIHLVRVYTGLGDALKTYGTEKGYDALLNMITSLRDADAIHIFDDMQNFFAGDSQKNAFVLFRGFRSACEVAVAQHRVPIVIAGRGLGFFSLHSKEKSFDGGVVTPITLQCLKLHHTYLLVHRKLFSDADFQKDDRIRQAAQLVHKVAAGVPLAVERVLDKCENLLKTPEKTHPSQLVSHCLNDTLVEDRISSRLSLALPQFSQGGEREGLLSLFLNLVWLHIANHSVSKTRNVYNFLSSLIQSIITRRGCDPEAANDLVRTETVLARICSLLPGYYDIHGDILRIHLPLISDVTLPPSSLCSTPLAFFQRARNMKATAYHWEECSRQCISAYMLLHDNLLVLDHLSGSTTPSFFSTIHTPDKGYHVDLATGHVVDLCTLAEVSILAKVKSIFKKQVAAPSTVVERGTVPASKGNPIDFALHVFKLILRLSEEWLTEPFQSRASMGPLIDFSVVSENSSADHFKAFLQWTGDFRVRCIAYRLVLISVQDKWGSSNTFDLMREFEKTWMFHCALPVLQKQLCKKHGTPVELHMEHVFLLIAPCANKGSKTYNQYSLLQHGPGSEPTRLTDINAVRLRNKQLKETNEQSFRQYWAWLRNRTQEKSHEKDFKDTSYDQCSMTDHIIVVTNENVKHLYGDVFANIVYKDMPSPEEAQRLYIQANCTDTHSTATFLSERGPISFDLNFKKRSPVESTANSQRKRK